MNILIADIILIYILNHCFVDCINVSSSRKKFNDVENLSAEPDYRAVKLNWNYYNEVQGLTGFKVKFCEISAWNSKIRCRERVLRLLSPQTSRKLSTRDDNNDPIIDKLIRLNRNSYEAHVYDLRMLTNYTFSVKADADQPISGYGRPSYHYFRPYSGSGSETDEYLREVMVETKSFAAKTSRCLANTSDVVVNTGPYFSGKITVEDASESRCAIYGNRSSNQNVYTLTIIHDLCGSKIINNSRIETRIMVHENREILTHNTRRFLVVCNFIPETYTLTASVAVPTHLLKRKHKSEADHSHNHSVESNVIPVAKPNINININRNADSNADNNIIDNKSNDIFTFDHYKQSHNVRDSRMLAQHLDHKILNENHIQTNSNTVSKSSSDHYWNQIFSTILFVISGLIFCVIALLWFTTTPRLSDNRKQIQSYVSMGSTAEHNRQMNKRKAVLSVNGSPIAVVSIDSLGESFA